MQELANKRNENFKTFVDYQLLKPSIVQLSRKSPDLISLRSNLINFSQESDWKVQWQYGNTLKTSRWNYNSISLWSNPLEAKEFIKKRDESLEKLNKTSFNFVAQKVLDQNSLRGKRMSGSYHERYQSSEERELNKCTFTPKTLTTYYAK